MSVYSGYYCYSCGEFFDEPRVVGSYIEKEYTCPLCGDSDIGNAKFCDNPNCTNRAPENVRLCKPCRCDLLKRFNAFADELTEPEEEALDDMFDGRSIKERKKVEELYG